MTMAKYDEIKNRWDTHKLNENEEQQRQRQQQQPYEK